MNRIPAVGFWSFWCNGSRRSHDSEDSSDREASWKSAQPSLCALELCNQLGTIQPPPAATQRPLVVSSSPNVSVIIPVFNTGQFLERCLDSVLDQTWRSLEVLAVNDGSTDGSAEILAAYARRDPRIQVFEQPNAGLAAARNRGVAEARGEYLAFIDSDDYVHPRMLASMLESASREGADVAICRFQQVAEDGEVLKTSSLPTGLSVDAWFRRILSAEDSSMACNKLFRRSLLVDSGVRFPVGLLHEDVPAIVQLIYHAQKIVVVDEPLYFWVRRSGTITSRTSVKHVLDLMWGFKMVQEFLDQHGIMSEYRAEFVQRVAHFSTGLVEPRRTGLDEATTDHIRSLLCAWFSILGITAADFEVLRAVEPGLLRRVKRMLPVDQELLEKVRGRSAYLESRMHEIESSNGFWLWMKVARLTARIFPAGTRRRALLARLTGVRSR